MERKTKKEKAVYGRSDRAITLIALIVTIIILIILASISIAMILRNNGLLNKTQTASDETKKSQATETMNLKITNIQISSYAETQELPSLQYLADKLCEDNDMEYVLAASKEHASLNKIDTTNVSSIFTKLKEYPYEFEINSSLQLASIEGVKIAENNNGGTVTLTQDQYNSILSRLTALENKSNNTNTNKNYSTEEQVAGTWIDGKPIYRKTICGKTPNAGVMTKMFPVTDIAKDIKQITSFYGSIFVTNTWTVPLNFYAGAYTSAQIDEGYFELYCSWFTGRDYHVTFEYTKTTD